MDKKNVADFYPLSPMQQGMLFHSLLDPSSGMYVEQLSCTIRGELDIPAFQQAWQQVVKRNTILRTGFLGEGLKEPVQVVHRQAPLPFEIQDWRDLGLEEQETRLDEFLAQDRARGFEHAKPPLMRIYLIQREEHTYQFIWTHHHIILDGWSIPLLFQEFLAAYEALRQGVETRLPSPIPYRNYIRWLKRQDLAASEKFWKAYLQDFDTPTQISPAPYPGAASEVAEIYDEQELWLPEELTNELQVFARSNKLTISTLVQGAWSILLGRYTGHDDVVFGSTTSGRPADLPGAETMIGLFINTLPIRVHLEEKQKVKIWLQGLQKMLAEVRQYEFTPLANIQKWSEIPPGQPLFDSLLVFENYPTASVLQGDLGSLEIVDIHSFEKTNYPLTFVSGLAGELMLKIIYARSGFTASTITAMLGHLKTILAGFIDHAEQPLAEVPILSAPEEHKLLHEWNATQAEFPADISVQEWFEDVATAQPENVAVVLEDEQLTFAELNRRANQLAHFLRKSGVGPETLVAICIERSLNMIVGTLGVLKAGGAYLPMDPANPTERLAFILADSRAPILLSHDTTISNLPIFADLESPPQIIRLDRDWDIISKEPDSNPEHTATAENLAYVIYTSGSTGLPKGTLLEHRGLCNLIQAFIEKFGIVPGTRVLQFFSYCFDGSIAEIFPALLGGGTLVLARENTLVSPADLHRVLQEEHVNIISMPPSMLAMLPNEDLPDLHTVISAGESCTPAVAQKWSSDFDLYNGYGPTENTVATSIHRISDHEAGGENISIGRPIANTQVYVLDNHLRPAPIGVPGELHVASVGLARGYLNRPDLTQQRFIPNPFSSDPHARLYKTGDLVRFRPDGNLEFLGRLDHQVKLRGFRIELGEIEAALAAHPNVQQAAVRLWQDPAREKYLAAYVTPQDDQAPSPNELRSYLQSSLPAYMLPAAYVTLSAFPKTPSGKIDRQALPAPDDGNIVRTTAYVAPRNPLEKHLASIWEQILGRKKIGVRDNFFELGGHSMLAVRLMGQIQQQYGTTIPLVSIFQHPTIEHLAELLEQQDGAVPISLLVPLKPSGTKPPLFFIHPSGGSVHWYIELSGLLGEDQPFYGIQAKGLHGESELHTEVVTMAAHYVKAMRDFHPDGPYLLGSWSMGVIIAYEVARQLAEQGREVAFLGLLDQGPELSSEEPEDQAAYLVEVFGKQLPLSVDHLRQLDEEEQIKHIWQVAKRANLVMPDITLEQFHNFIHILSTHTNAWRKYEPQPFPGKITLFRAQEQGDNAPEDPDMGWARLAQQGVEIVDVPGNHLTMIHEPHVQVLAEKMQECLAKALTGSLVTG